MLLATKMPPINVMKLTCACWSFVCMSMAILPMIQAEFLSNLPDATAYTGRLFHLSFNSHPYFGDKQLDLKVRNDLFS